MFAAIVRTVTHSASTGLSTGCSTVDALPFAVRGVTYAPVAHPVPPASPPAPVGCIGLYTSDMPLLASEIGRSSYANLLCERRTGRPCPPSRGSSSGAGPGPPASPPSPGC
eukprot:8974099-Pyramimonas_sp.AAC.2